MVVSPDQAAPAESSDGEDGAAEPSGWRERLRAWTHRWGPVKYFARQ